MAGFRAHRANNVMMVAQLLRSTMQRFMAARLIVFYLRLTFGAMEV